MHGCVQALRLKTQYFSIGYTSVVSANSSKFGVGRSRHDRHLLQVGSEGFRPPSPLIFLLKEQQKTKDLCASRSGLGACCLTILIYTLICLRVRCDHASPTFPDFNMNVYIGKHERLYR